MMKVFNLTDVETPKLKQHGLLNQSIEVGGKSVEPGASMELEGTPWERASARHAESVGALSVDALPGEYTTAKAAPKPAKPVAPPAPQAPPAPAASGALAPDFPPVSKRGKAV